MLPAPKVPGVTHCSSSNLVVGGMRMAEVRFGCGSGAGGATAVRRVAVDPGSYVATAGIAAGDCEFSLAARDRVVRDEDIPFRIAPQYSLLDLCFPLFWHGKRACFGG